MADIGLGRLLVPARGRFDSVSGYADRALLHVSCPVCREKFLNDMFGLAIVTLPEVVIPNPSIPVNKVIGRPVFVVERIPNFMTAINGNRIGDVQLVHGVLYVYSLFF